ncbi:MAG: MBL fold metallo-hydrolase, partial [Candidatus Gastranaerophilales bacterium]|nr:MBL fold metallo-hydrolase [Candidatus Gastranaerophilales bacterium]
YIMIDTGRQIYKDLTTAKTITLEYLYNKNVREIDTLIVTHFDSDHSGGLIDILENVKVKRLIMPKPACTSKNSCAIKEYISKNNIKYIEPFSGQKFDFEGDIHLVNYVPFENQLKTNLKQKSKNMYSTVTLLIAGGRKFLFMADAPLKSYKNIKDKIPNNIDVLKIAHHGAFGTLDDEMMYKLRPKFSVISTGKNNYGHPGKDTVKLISKYSIPLSTKDYGAIKFEILNPNFYYEFFEVLFRKYKNADKKPNDVGAVCKSTACKNAACDNADAVCKSAACKNAACDNACEPCKGVTGSNAGADWKDMTCNNIAEPCNNTGKFSRGNNGEPCRDVTDNNIGVPYKSIVNDSAAKNNTGGVCRDVTDKYLNNDTKTNLIAKHYEKQIRLFIPIRIKSPCTD